MFKGKGQVEISFNWIFILIAGGLILFFFITFISNQKDASMAEISQRVQARFDNIFTIIQQTPDSVQSFDHINLELEFSCEEGIQSYSVVGSRASTFIDDQIIFSAPMIGDSKLIAWTRNFRGAYPVTPVLYLSDERTKYFFVGDNDGFVKSLFNLMPEVFTKDLVTENGVVLADDDFRHYIIIQSNDSDIDISTDGLPSYSVLTISLEGVHGDVPFGNVSSDNAGEAKFTGYEMVLGAVITGDSNLFECSRDKLLRRYVAANEVQIQRINELWAAYKDLNSNHDCKDVYHNETGLAIKTLKNIQDKLRKFEHKNLAQIISGMDNLNEQSRRKRCAYLY